MESGCWSMEMRLKVILESVLVVLRKERLSQGTLMGNSVMEHLETSTYFVVT